MTFKIVDPPTPTPPITWGLLKQASGAARAPAIDRPRR